jgi:hypothetical protein
MPIVYNTTEEAQTFKVYGKWFTFSPGQKKAMSEDIASFIGQERRDQGMMILPQEFEDSPEYATTEEGKAELERLKSQGVGHYIDFHRAIIRNNQISLRRDLGKGGTQIDPGTEVSPGELNSMRLVAKYQIKRNDEKQNNVDEVKKLMTAVGVIE